MIPDEKDEAEGTDLGHTDKPVGEDLGDEKLPPDDDDTADVAEDEDNLGDAVPAGEEHEQPDDESEEETP